MLRINQFTFIGVSFKKGQFFQRDNFTFYETAKVEQKVFQNIMSVYFEFFFFQVDSVENVCSWRYAFLLHSHISMV